MARSFALMLILVLSPAVSADWVKLGENERSTIYIHSDFKKIIGIRQAWMLFDYKEVQVSPLSGRRYLTEKAQWEIDCDGEKVRVLSSIWHAKSMGNGVVVYTTTTPTQWLPTSAPKSFAEIAHHYTCGDKQKI